MYLIDISPMMVIRPDNGPEFITMSLQEFDWSRWGEDRLHHARQYVWRNAFVESLNCGFVMSYRTG